MRAVCLLCRLGAAVMAWTGLTRHLARTWSRLCSWIRYLLGLLGLLWPLPRWTFRGLMLTIRPALPGPEERGNRDRETGDGDPDRNGAGRREDTEAGPGTKRAAGGQDESESKRQKTDEEEDEEHGVETTDEFYCEYDSTWEDESDEKAVRKSRPQRNYRDYRSQKFWNFERAAQDMQNFRRGYPNQNRENIMRRNSEDSDLEQVDMPNLRFYLGETTSEPDGAYISDFHAEWYGKYDRLERVHTFIQWLFPLQEPGMNYRALPLTPQEVKEFCVSDVAKNNLQQSYELMLDFYGIKLCDKETGEVQRAENWRNRFDNLNRHAHNNLRITRILKCLGTLGFQHYQAPLVRFFLKETLIEGKLPRVKESVLNYFLFAVLDKQERRELIKFAYLSYDHRDEFVWCPKKIQKRWSQEKKNAEGGDRDSSPSGELSPHSESQSESEEDT